jgi:hypothetical protein
MRTGQSRGRAPIVIAPGDWRKSWAGAVIRFWGNWANRSTAERSRGERTLQHCSRLALRAEPKLYAKEMVEASKRRGGDSRRSGPTGRVTERRGYKTHLHIMMRRFVP